MRFLGRGSIEFSAVIRSYRVQDYETDVMAGEDNGELVGYDVFLRFEVWTMEVEDSIAVGGEGVEGRVDVCGGYVWWGMVY